MQASRHTPVNLDERRYLELITKNNEMNMVRGGKLWNALPASEFPTSNDLTSFNRKVSRHLSISFG